jgi:NAD(P)-dependent dehydrogenase (short-subunit alcohol dehydrogenase family)
VNSIDGDRIQGNVTIITGAAGNLGSATVRVFEAARASLVLWDHAADRLVERFPELAESDDHLVSGGVDLTDEASVSRATSQAVERFGRIDTLVSTVGTFIGGAPVHEESLDTWDRLYALNVRTAVAAARAVIPHMVEARRGAIVNVASRNALAGDAGVAAYSATKAAVLRLTESLAAELGDAGVRVNAVLPGTIDTPENRKAAPDADFSRWVSPEAIAEVILFLASDAARAVQGTAIPLTGHG